MKTFVLFIFCACATMGRSQNLIAFGDSMSAIGHKYHNEGNPKTAIEFHVKALDSFEKGGNTNKAIITTNDLGIIYLELGDIEKALEYFNTALKAAEKTKDQDGLSFTFNSLASTYLQINDLDNALNFFNKALEIQKKENDKKGIALSLHNIGFIHYQNNNLKDALSYSQKSLKLSQELNDKTGIANSYHQLAVLYFTQGNTSKGLEYDKLALQIHKEINNKERIAASLGSIGDMYYASGNTEEAIKYATRSLEIAKEFSYPMNIYNASDLLYAIYQKQKQPAKALEMYQLRITMRDSLNNEETRKALIKNQIQYEFDKKEAALKAEQEKKDALAAEQSKQKNYLMIGLSVLFLFSLLIGWLVFRQNKLKSEQKAIQLEQKLLRLQMNPHFIFNSLTAIESFMYEKQPEEAGKYLSDFSRLMRMVLENSREETISLETEINTLSSFLRLQQLNLEDTFSYSINIDENLNLEKIKVPPMLFQPFVENAIKHGCADVEHGHVSVSFKQKENSLIIEIADNGKGIQAEKRNKTHKSLATTITKERLSIINSKAKIIYFEIVDNFPVGTKVNFNIPID